MAVRGATPGGRGLARVRASRPDIADTLVPFRRNLDGRAKLVGRPRRSIMAPITKMRIHRFGGKEVLQADDVEPSLPDAGQVLVAVRASSVNPVDFKIRSGKYPAVKDDRLPYTLGRHFSGVVEKCGAQATRFK